MNERRPAPASADAAVMAEYFETMRQFLDTQSQVMAAFMGESPAPRSAQRIQRSIAPVAMPRLMDASPARAPAPSMPAVAPASAPARMEEPAHPAHEVAAARAQAAEPVAIAVAARAVPSPEPPARSAAAAKASESAGFDREKLTATLLTIVEEKTGYPRDMVGLDQNLESDLGIDSIKRIEVVGAMLQALPEQHRQALHASRSKLNTQSTLNGMLDMLSSAAPGGVEAGTSEPAAATRPRVDTDERRRA
mgnify:FL=1